MRGIGRWGGGLEAEKQPQIGVENDVLQAKAFEEQRVNATHGNETVSDISAGFYSLCLTDEYSEQIYEMDIVQSLIDVKPLLCSLATSKSICSLFHPKARF